MNLCDPKQIRQLMDEIESERVRLQGWIPTVGKHGDMFIFRCRRLAKIRENLRMLAESYEEK
jgi:hypothetical protein